VAKAVVGYHRGLLHFLTGRVKMSKEKSKQEHKVSRREFVKKAAYIAPAIITLQAAPSYARAGSDKNQDQQGQQGQQGQR